MNLRRTLTLLSAMVMTTGVLAAGAPSASATTLFCNTTVGGPFDGTQVCVVRDELIESTVRIPYSVGSICVAGQCTPPVDGGIDIPTDVDEDPIESYGSICIPWIKNTRLCQPFNTGDLY